MAQMTEAGDIIAWRLNPAIGTTTEIRETCALLRRHAVTYSHIQEGWCNIDYPDRERERVEQREQQIEARMRDLAYSLPEVDGEHFAMMFQGDPRGYTAILVPPGEWAAKLGNHHGPHGIDGLGLDDSISFMRRWAR